MTGRERFEAWASETWMCDCQFDADRNCYIEFPVHMAWKGWQASRKQALEQMGMAARKHGLTLVLTANGLNLMQLGKITAQANPEGEQG